MEDQGTQFLLSTDDNSNNKALDIIDDSVVDSALDSEKGLLKKRGRGRPSLKLSMSQTSVKRSRGRPRGSGKLQILASLGGYIAETAGGNLTPHVMTVNTGEDVVAKILAFSQQCPQAAVCILSATGVVSSLLIRKLTASSSSILRCEGCFEILSLSGSYTGNGDANLKKGMLTISLAKPDGTVFGGELVGSLIAAGPIQLIIGSFKQNICKEILRRNSAGSSSTPNMSRNSDLETVPLNVPRMIEGEQSCPSPTSGLLPTTNNKLLPENVIHTTNTRVSENVNISTNQNIHSGSVNGIGMDLQPITDQRISADDDSSVKFSSGQL